MKRTLSILLLMALLLSAVGCGSSEDNSGSQTNNDAQTADTITESKVPEETEPLSDEELRNLVSDDLPDVSYEGSDFNIISRTNFAYEFNAEEITGETLNDALYTRNITVEDRFAVNINTIPYGEGNMAYVLTPMEQSVMANDNAYQLGAAYSWTGAKGSISGSFANIYDIERINLEKPWWSQGYTEEATINGKSYIATGDLSLLFNEVTMAVFFNKQIAEELSVGNVYSIVKEGKWTFDKMKEWSELAASDTNGDGEMTAEDRWGIGVNRYTHIDCFLFAFQVPLSERNEEGIPVITINNEKMVSTVEKLTSFFHDSKTALLCNHGSNGFDAGMFESGKGFMMTSWLGNAQVLRDMDTDFGIIPYPKWDEEQENYTTYNLDRATCFLIPITADYEFVGTITEAMAAESYKKVIPAFYDVTLKNKSARDEESQEMIDLIRASVNFDFLNIYSNVFGNSNPVHLLRSLVWNNNTDFSSTYAKNKKVYERTFEVFLESFTDSAETAETAETAAAE